MLVITLVILTGVILAGLYSATQSTVDTRLAANYKAGTQAYFAAEAGIEDARIRLPGIAQDPSYTSDWAYTLSSADPFNYSVQIKHKTERDLGENLNGDSDFDDIIYWGDKNQDGIWEQNLTTGKPVEIITSVGNVSKSTVTIIAEMIRNSLDMKYAVWGNVSVDIKNSGKIWKGDATEPYVADVGSNENIDIENKADIYGSVDIGQDIDGEPGDVTIHAEASIHGIGPISVKRVNPDPLGAFSADSDLFKDFEKYSSNNDNASATGTDKKGKAITITGDTIDLDSTMTLKHGNYYLESITLRAGATLNIDVSSGPVNIYLTGSLEAENAGNINISPNSSKPGKFTIYCKADDTGSSSTSIDLKHSSNFSGVIYAPKANCRLHNSGNYYGMIWGNSVVINNSGQVIYDPDLKNKFLSPTYTLRSWKEERS